MNTNTGRWHERGIASILTVIFFILIASVVTIGFLRLSLNEGQQALEDSLSKSALAAAYSGVNDAKRAMLYCLQYEGDPVAHPECDENRADSIYNPDCPGYFINDAVTGKFAMPKYDDLPDGGMPVGDDPTDTINERYTCVTIADDTYDVIGSLLMDQSSNTTLIPLRSTSAFNAVRISWDLVSVLPPNFSQLNYNGDSARANYRDNNAYGNNFEWHDDWPALLRMSLYAHPNAGVNYVDTDGSTNISEVTSHLYPLGSLSATSTSVSVGGAGALIPRQLVNCNATAGFSTGGSRYHCQLTIANLNSSASFNPTNNILYLQLTGMYVDADYSVELLNGVTPVKFDDVSPEVDATGAVGDTYRRVEARLRYQGSAPLLPNAIDTGSGICKNFMIGNDVSIFNETCGY